jgi:hypothetical protein
MFVGFEKYSIIDIALLNEERSEILLQIQGRSLAGV